MKLEYYSGGSLITSFDFERDPEAQDSMNLNRPGKVTFSSDYPTGYSAKYSAYQGLVTRNYNVITKNITDFYTFEEATLGKSIVLTNHLDETVYGILVLLSVTETKKQVYQVSFDFVSLPND